MSTFIGVSERPGTCPPDTCPPANGYGVFLLIQKPTQHNPYIKCLHSNAHNMKGALLWHVFAILVPWPIFKLFSTFPHVLALFQYWGLNPGTNELHPKLECF